MPVSRDSDLVHSLNIRSVQPTVEGLVVYFPLDKVFDTACFTYACSFIYLEPGLG